MCGTARLCYLYDAEVVFHGVRFVTQKDSSTGLKVDAVFGSSLSTRIIRLLSLIHSLVCRLDGKWLRLVPIMAKLGRNYELNL